MAHARQPRIPLPLDPAGLRALALAYVGRYATSSGKLRQYLERKLRERGWETEHAPDLTSLIDDFTRLGYIDDDSFARIRTEALQRRGYGPARIRLALRGAGLNPAQFKQEEDIATQAKLASAFAWAKRKRFGPHATTAPDEKDTRRAISSMLRAGHDYAVIRHVLGATLDDISDSE